MFVCVLVASVQQGTSSLDEKDTESLRYAKSEIFDSTAECGCARLKIAHNGVRQPGKCRMHGTYKYQQFYNYNAASLKLNARDIGTSALALIVGTTYMQHPRDCTD